MDKNERELINGIFNYVKNSYEKIPDVADEIRQGQGLDYISSIVEGLFTVLKAFDMLSERPTVEFGEAEIEKIARHILDAVNSNDFNKTADIFQLEIIPVFEEWSEKISAFMTENG